LAAGTVHVLAGPDHLAALAPIAVDEPKRATRLGLMWGSGHGLGVALLGTAGILGKTWLDVEALSAWSEFFIGFTLIVLGLWALRQASGLVIHSHDHEHTDEGHSHYHVHTPSQTHDGSAAHTRHSHAAFTIGILHGTAGTGHLLGVLPSLALPPIEAAIYLVAYVGAAIASMTAFGALLGRFLRSRRVPELRRFMVGVAGLAVALGVFWMGNSWPL
jgi:hypothetical protein